MPTSPTQSTSGRAVSASRVTVRRMTTPAPPSGGVGQAAAGAASGAEAGRADWLPWALSVFGAACAAFVLVKGVLPARNENAQLMQQVARLESAALNASTERASHEQVRGQLEARYSSAQAQLEGESAARQKQKKWRDAARQELSQVFVDQFADGSVWLEEHEEQLVIDIQEKLLFRGERTELTGNGRQLLSALAEVLKHQPPEQVFQIGAHTDPPGRAKAARAASKEGSSPSGARVKTSWELSARRAANVARFLEERGGLSGQQLVAAGFSSHRPATSAASDGPEKNRRVEIVLLAGKS